MKRNAPKTEVMYIDEPLHIKSTLESGSTVIGGTDSYRHLGVSMITDLKMTKHLKNGHKMLH